MSTSPRRSAVDSVSMRPDGSGRGRLAVARIAAATSLVRGVACMGGLPNILDRPAMVRRTPGCAQGSSRLASQVGSCDGGTRELHSRDGYAGACALGQVRGDHGGFGGQAGKPPALCPGREHPPLGRVGAPGCR